MTTASETRIKQDKDWRQRLDAILQEMKEANGSTLKVQPGKVTGLGRHRSLAITHLEDTIMRLGMDMKEVNEMDPGAAPTPYPESYNPANAKVEPTADGIKL